MRVHACVTLLPLLPKRLFSQGMHKKQNKKVNAGGGGGMGGFSLVVWDPELDTIPC